MAGQDRNADGTRVMTPSRLDDLALRHGLNPAEAEELFNRREAGENEATAAQAIRDARKVYRAHVERTYSEASDPRLIPERKRQADERAREDELGSFAPEAGPYGPNTDYTEASTGNVTRAQDLYR